MAFRSAAVIGLRRLNPHETAAANGAVAAATPNLRIPAEKRRTESSPVRCSSLSHRSSTGTAATLHRREVDEATTAVGDFARRNACLGGQTPGASFSARRQRTSGSAISYI